MTHPTIGDKMALTGKVMELKLGKSFDSGVNQTNPAFHTFRYDFKPASVDASQMARVDVEQRNQVSVTVPHHDSTASTVFRGSQRPYQKECVLIIDHRTGEVTLERLSCNVQLKKTRAEGSSKVSLSSQPGGPVGVTSHGRPLTPNTTGPQQSTQLLSGSQSNDGLDQVSSCVNSKMKRPSPPIPSQRAHTGSPVSTGTSKQRISPVIVSAPNGGIGPQTSSSSRQGTKGGSPGSANSVSARRPAAALSANSMPLLVDDSGRLDETGLNLQQQAQATQPAGNLGHYAGRPSGGSIQSSMPLPDSNTEVVEMSEGSSSSSSGSSSEGSDSESESDTVHVSRSGSSAVLSVPTLPVTNNATAVYGSNLGTNHLSGVNSKGSMAKLSQLSEDLQLSESGSDSD